MVPSSRWNDVTFPLTHLCEAKLEPSARSSQRRAAQVKDDRRATVSGGDRGCMST